MGVRRTMPPSLAGPAEKVPPLARTPTPTRVKPEPAALRASGPAAPAAASPSTWMPSITPHLPTLNRTISVPGDARLGQRGGGDQPDDKERLGCVFAELVGEAVVRGGIAGLARAMRAWRIHCP